VAGLSDDQLRGLLEACKGPSFRDKRDEAAVRLLSETRLQASEGVALQVADLDLKRGLVSVRRGKGAKGR
jgi:integrase/recombinase XerD